MRKYIFCWIIFVGFFIFSCNKTPSKEILLEDDDPVAPTVIPYQVPGLTVTDNEYYVETIVNDFIGVYFPVEYINSLINSRNHSLSLHSNARGVHDVLAVTENVIFANLQWHDQYGISAAEADLFQYIKHEEETIIIDNNGHIYRKIGNEPENYYSIAMTFVTEIVLSELIEQGTGISVSNGKIMIPFLYFFTGEDTFFINLDDMFFEKGLNLILISDNRFDIGIVIDGSDYYFYRLKRKSGYDYERSDVIYCYKLNEDRNVIVSLSGLNENNESEYIDYINGLTEYDKRIIVNMMFALNGYYFLSEEWQSFFDKYSWYEPNSEIKNDPNILNIRQKRLFEYLSQ